MIFSQSSLISFLSSSFCISAFSKSWRIFFLSLSFCISAFCLTLSLIKVIASSTTSDERVPTIFCGTSVLQKWENLFNNFQNSWNILAIMDQNASSDMFLSFHFSKSERGSFQNWGYIFLKFIKANIPMNSKQISSAHFDFYS